MANSFQDSIPADKMAIFGEWTVKQVVITKTGSSIQTPNQKLGITLKTNHLTVKRLSTLSRMGTSKIHKFTPSVSINQSVNWLSEYGACDASIMFDNGCAVLFEQGKFLEFEDIRDEDDEDQSTNQSINQSTNQSIDQQAKSADHLEDDSHEYVYPQPETVEKFKLGTAAD